MQPSQYVLVFLHGKAPLRTLPSQNESFSDWSLSETGTNTTQRSHGVLGQGPCLMSFLLMHTKIVVSCCYTVVQFVSQCKVNQLLPVMLEEHNTLWLTLDHMVIWVAAGFWQL